jgi:protein-tyrosine phosphatase
MASILVICTGNICRSPMAEGFLRRLLAARAPTAGFRVSSAGTSAWDGSAATREAVEAAVERDTDISGHSARRLTPDLVEDADLVVGMTAEHRDRAAGMAPGAADRVFTLKELARLLEAVPPTADGRDGDAGLRARVAAAEELRRGGFPGNPNDEDVIDPIGLPLGTYRAVAWEIDEWCERLVDGLLGRQHEPAGTGAEREAGP